jgi:DNA replication and repair protein RecF
MILRKLKINNFKNIAEASMTFSPKVNCLLGNNGMGKSNLLDALYYLSFCKSFTGVNDAMLIRRDEDFMMLQADYDRKGVDEELLIGMQRGRRKSVKRSGKEYRRLSEHIGLFPLVMVAPADMDLITGTSEERRRFIDMVISQSDTRYLENLIRYGQALEQRNRLLRDGSQDRGLFSAVEIQMDMAADYITKVRAAEIARLSEIFITHYRSVAAGNEVPALSYNSKLNDEQRPLTDLLEQARQRDEILHYTTVGPHRDDIDMTIDSMAVRRIASQGQAKTFTVALRFAQYDFLRKASGLEPLLLLDDIFDKLDAERVERIMNVVTSDAFGQIFITDTNRKHLDEIMARTGGDYCMWHVVNGEFNPINKE